MSNALFDVCANMRKARKDVSKCPPTERLATLNWPPIGYREFGINASENHSEGMACLYALVRSERTTENLAACDFRALAKPTQCRALDRSADRRPAS